MHKTTFTILLYTYSILLFRLIHSYNYLHRFSISKLSTKTSKFMSIDNTDSTSALWNAEQGVWINQMVPSVATPSRLFVFGYGSLIWNPGDYLRNFPCIRCTSKGWKREFAQRSMDHRGTPIFPGVVLNLVSKNSEEGTPEDSFPCNGVIFDVPNEMKEEVLAYLDFREKGGYSRQIIQVELLTNYDEYREGEIIDVLVYVGKETNPNYFRPDPFFLQTSYQEHHPPTVHKRLKQRCVTSDLISSAFGQSGYNIDYLFNLETYFHLSGIRDPYLVAMGEKVRRRLGLWRGLLYQTESTNEVIEEEVHAGYRLYGWGSNEFHQLYDDAVSMKKSSIDDQSSGSSSQPSIPNIEHNYFALPISLNYPQLTRSAAMDADPIQPLQLPSSIHRRTTLFGGGGSTGILSGHRLFLFGTILDSLFPIIHQYTQSSVAHQKWMGSADPHRCCLVLEDIECVTIGHDHIVVMLHSTRQAVALGNLQCTGWSINMTDHNGIDDNPLTGLLATIQRIEVIHQTIDNQSVVSYKIIPTESSDDHSTSDDPVVKITTGLRQTALITKSGRFFSCGNPSYQVWGWTPPPLPADYYEAEAISRTAPLSLIDVACGVKHTIVIDSYGRVYSTGSNLYGALGRLIHLEQDTTTEGSHPYDKKDSFCPKMKSVEKLPEQVLWQRVCSGWNHAVVRGLRPDGVLLFYGWGRNDLRQYATVDHVMEADLSWLLHALMDYGWWPNAWTIPEFLILWDETDQKYFTDTEKQSKPWNQNQLKTWRIILHESLLANWMYLMENEREFVDETINRIHSMKDVSEIDKASLWFTAIILFKSNHGRDSIHHIPKRLVPLPSGVEVSEVWCGSEYTIVADELTGRLWSCGWNEHGNLGIGESPDVVASILEEGSHDYDNTVLGRKGRSDIISMIDQISSKIWKPVKTNQSNEYLELKDIGEGSLACGGSHVLCVAMASRDKI